MATIPRLWLAGSDDTRRIYGGSPVDDISESIIVEELSRVDRRLELCFVSMSVCVPKPSHSWQRRTEAKISA